MISPAVLYEQVLSGRISIDALAWLAEAFRQHDRDDGHLALDRYLKLPTRAQRVRTRRNYYLRQAGALLDPALSQQERAEALRTSLFDFMTRGRWQSSAELPDPPAEFSELYQCLWYVAKAIRTSSAIPCVKQIGNVLAEIESA